ncbi:beta-ketoacyl synthase [Putridiphycobacter roseus]|uniref:Beta-ketoacyl synthase n=1 Tax=Putridiphycobacter roseus TaxID=2219161 RepID=A0A2W1NM16_9FLAO|nr:beta-ketoacyl synthase N-terminal-like domain-containing protein [Putridiphycobacter roseus]PZE16692.1 beta-ketoacyl synthase [Putridiphycobacter roseus]
MLKEPINIASYSSISPLGNTPKQVWNNYLNPRSFISNQPMLSADLSPDSESLLSVLKQDDKKYQTLDKSVLMGIYAGRNALAQTNWTDLSNTGINMGSSRGATQLFEENYALFNRGEKIAALTSPTTTLGNIATWLAHDLSIEGPAMSHSITCSTAMHALLNGIAWLNAGMSDQFIVGASEAANTAFTIAQMQALKIYSKDSSDYPCHSLQFDKTKNSMVLGEGSVVFCLSPANNPSDVAQITSVGYATEKIKHGADISANATCFQKSMKMALAGFDGSDIDAIVMHAPGTVKGDQSEWNAIEKVFGANHPAITSNKWKIGHSLGASGGLSIEMAILMLQNNQLIESPFYQNKPQTGPLKNIMVNAVGFGGNAVSIVVSIG